MHAEQERDLIAWFWNNVDKAGDCWLWLGNRDDGGYGRFGLNYKQYKAHRFAYEQAYGALLPGFVVCHRCDNPSCVRPSHLFHGTQADNMHDRAHKGRYYRLDGSATVGRSKLTPAQVQEIRARYIPRKVTTYQLAREYGVSQPVIYSIISGKIWKGLEAA